MVLGWGEKPCAKRRNCWLPAFSAFLTMFSKELLFRVIKYLPNICFTSVLFCEGYSEIPDDDLRGMKTIEILRLNDNKFER